jgi:biotin carboxyl carrier protein
MKTLVAIRETSGGADTTEILSSAVGRYHDAPPVGTYVSPGSPLGVLRVLRRSYALVAPEGTSGFVQEVLVAGGLASVEYGQPILLLTTGALEGIDAGSGAAVSEAATDDVPEGMLALRAPTDGIFYRRPSPDQPSYVEEGEEVERGRIVALVEVMKCFSQISYGGDGAPDRARVVRVVPEDSAEVKSGQVLLVLEPLRSSG